MRISVVVGTRPEAIKMAPVITRLQKEPGIDIRLYSTGQHREMLRQVFDIFDLVPDLDLDLMRPCQSLTDIASRALEGIGRQITLDKPDIVLVHGDTTTALAAALAGFYAGVPIGHVEAGLRTYHQTKPWPEEMNRRAIDSFATYLFAPTAQARDNLLKENLGDRHILVTGNTVVDALLKVAARVRTPEVSASFGQEFQFIDPNKKLILVTGHRRESFGAGFEAICQALATLAARHDSEIVYPVHLNPSVREPVCRILQARPNIHLIEPCDYLRFVYLMDRAHLILTDSGGVQEEAPSLGKPVLVMRDVTERPEGLASGAIQLVSADAGRIVAETVALLDDSARYEAMRYAGNPFGDGHAADRIAEALRPSAKHPRLPAAGPPWQEPSN